MYKYFILLNIILLLNGSCVSQNVEPIIQGKRYSQEISTKNSNYHFFGGYFIDPGKKGVIDLLSLEKGINTIIKDTSYSGYIVLDIENKVYKELRSNTINHVNYSKNIKSFVDMVKLVKNIRPNAKVIVYNIPFKFNSENQKKYNNFEKLYPLLEVVDAFAPSLYLHYNDKQRKSKYFSTYIKNNLDLNFEYAEKLNKKVYPFIWYRIHPSNNKYSNEIVHSKQYSDYLNLIKNYKYKNQSIEKIIYWEPANETINIDDKLKETIKLLKK